MFTNNILANSPALETINSANQINVFDISIIEVVDGKVNLTKICQHFGKDVRKWTKQEGVKAILSALQEDEPNVAHLEIKHGVGTFGTREIALELTRWISPKFAVWANKQIDTLLQTGRVELQPKELSRMEILQLALEAEKENQKLKAELQHKQSIIQPIIESVPPKTMRAKINQICRHSTKSYQGRWNELYYEFKYIYRIDLKTRYENSKKKGVGYKNILELAECEGFLNDLYKLALSLFENNTQIYG